MLNSLVKQAKLILLYYYDFSIWSFIKWIWIHRHTQIYWDKYCSSCLSLVLLIIRTMSNIYLPSEYNFGSPYGCMYSGYYSSTLPYSVFIFFILQFLAFPFQMLSRTMAVEGLISLCLLNTCLNQLVSLLLPGLWLHLSAYDFTSCKIKMNSDR